MSEAPVIITAKLNEPIGLNFLGNDPTNRFVTLCPVRYQYGAEVVDVEERFEFDGPTIPRPFWIFAEMSPADLHTILASLPHDWGCIHPSLIPRAIADSIFFETLGPVIFNGRALLGVTKPRRLEMAAAVEGYSLVSGKGWR